MSVRVVLVSVIQLFRNLFLYTFDVRQPYVPGCLQLSRKSFEQPAVAAGDETTLHYPKIQLIFSSTNNFVVKIIPRSLHLCVSSYMIIVNNIQNFLSNACFPSNPLLNFNELNYLFSLKVLPSTLFSSLRSRPCPCQGSCPACQRPCPWRPYRARRQHQGCSRWPGCRSRGRHRPSACRARSR